MRLPKELLDAIAVKEAKMIYEGFDNPEVCNDLRFLQVVRKFLKDNEVDTPPLEVEKLATKVVTEIPVFDEVENI